ncbi:MAG: sigma-70 family RNA polymerase sigma factor [Betaproteobacteria bacterium]|nr:sigma-70 family RNA polymerase sigma factor [Betaproteobacteria bacterium]
MAERSPTQGAGVTAAELDRYRPYLVRYARLQLRDQSSAEDVVQETLLVAIENGDRFSGQSSVRTWLTGILKHKIIDVFRRGARELPLAAAGRGEDATEEQGLEALFHADGRWRAMPGDWGDPDRAFENQEFWRVFEACTQAMSVKSARAFVMREVMGLTTDEICKELDISATNCWVLLHRARVSLRACLETKWFSKAR